MFAPSIPRLGRIFSARASLIKRAALSLGIILLAQYPAESAFGAELAEPQGSVLLKVTGAISRMNDGDQAVFDRKMLDDLPQRTFTTSTIWTDGAKTFSGPTLLSVMDAIGASGSTITTYAVNDYRIDIPLADLTEEAPIIATKIDGQEFGVREKGPLWLVYPYDSSAEYQTEVVYSRSIWQLIRIVVSD